MGSNFFMGLESLLKPLEIVDDQLLRRYTGLTKKWEGRGHSKYSLSLPLNILAMGSFTSYIDSLQNIFSIGSLYTFPNATNFTQSLFGIVHGNHNGIRSNGDNFSIESPFLYIFNKVSEAIRTPELVAGISFIGKGAVDIYNYFANNEPSLLEGIQNLSIGTSFVSNASATFIRNSDPKILDKDSLLKKTYKGIREKIDSLLPSPQPIPETKPA